jgi:hypothetical protein
MNEDDEIKKELEDYTNENFNVIQSLYSKYLELVDKIKLDKYWTWGSDQMAAVMLLAEQKHAALMERLELEIEKQNRDPFESSKMACYRIAKNENGSIMLVCTRITYEDKEDFTYCHDYTFDVQLMEQDLIDTLDNNKQ